MSWVRLRNIAITTNLPYTWNWKCIFLVDFGILYEKVMWGWKTRLLCDDYEFNLSMTSSYLYLSYIKSNFPIESNWKAINPFQHPQKTTANFFVISIKTGKLFIHKGVIAFIDYFFTSVCNILLKYYSHTVLSRRLYTQL